MEYAQTRNLESLTEAGSDPDSPFERSVIECLETEGYEVHPQVGCAGFRIDLAIPDPDYPGRYVLGIECDGAAYHSSPVARARDRQRQTVLEDRGWDIHRVWSTDWYREKGRTKQLLLQAVEDAIERNAKDMDKAAPGDRSRDDVEEPDENTDDVDENPSIEELQSDGEGLSLTDICVEYQPATGIPYSQLGDHDVRSTRQAVEHIVSGEGPIHRDLVAKRVVSNSDVSRRGSKVSKTIDKAIRIANLDRRGEFLYPKKFSSHSVRRRDGMAAEIEWIPDGEIEVAIVEILEKQYATPREDLIKQVGTVLGFARTGTRIADQIGDVIEEMLQDGQLKRSDTRLAIPDSE